MRPLCVSLIVCLGVALAGCGGSGSVASGASKSAGKRFTAAADAICIANDKRISAISASVSGSISTSKAMALASRVIAIVAATSSKLAALTPPSSERADYAKALAAANQTISLDRLQIAYARQHGTSPTTAMLSQANDASDRTAHDFKAIGLKQCAAS